MATRPQRFRPTGVKPLTKQDRDRDNDDRRGKTAARGYDGRWQRAKAAHLRANPLCAYCEAGAFDEPRLISASLVDHLHPHRGDRRLFWCSAVWLSSCADCHNGPKQALERKGDAAVDALARRLGLPTRVAALAMAEAGGCQNPDACAR